MSCWHGTLAGVDTGQMIEIRLSKPQSLILSPTHTQSSLQELLKEEEVGNLIASKDCFRA